MSGKIENTLIKLDCVDSTNNYATNHLVKEGWIEGTVVLTDFQNKGKGQTSNSWESEKGKNLLFSIVLYPGFIQVHNQFLISKVIALGVCEVVSLFADNTSIKWPNDIYVENKKIGGILIENAIMGTEFSYSVAGVGLNVNQHKFLSDAPNPVSFLQLTEIEYDSDEIFAMVIQSINKWYEILKRKEFSVIDMAYLKRLYRFGVEAKFKDDNGIFTGRIVGVDQTGQLMIEKSSDEIRSYYFKEVAFL